MDSHEWNKIVGAVLGTLLLVFGIRIVSNLVFEVEDPETPGYEIAVAEEGTDGAAAAEEEAVTPLPVLLASADAEAGAASMRKCAACHTFEKGGAHRVGPNLYNTMGFPIAAHEGYAYSNTLANAEGDWNWETLSAFLEAPSKAFPGTKMSFAGLKNPQERANVLAYLNTITDTPLPLPEVQAEPASAPADGTTAQPQEGTGADTNVSGETTNQPATEPQALEAEQPRVVPEGQQTGGQTN